MQEISINAPAKINLFLDVLRKRDDGYHDLRMIMQMVSLYDEVNVKKCNSGIELKTSLGFLPVGEKNTAFKAAKLMIETFKIRSGVEVSINKNIPVGAGLAGGSSDAAAVLHGINQLFDLGQKNEDLAKLGKKVGADVPFCVYGGTALVEGIGDEITPLNALEDVDILLVKPKFSVSTAEVFGCYRFDKCPGTSEYSQLVESINKKDVNSLCKNLYNALERVTADKYPIINQIKQKLIDFGAIGSLMSGSGSTVYGIFRSKELAQKAYAKIKNNYELVFLGKTI